MADEIDVRSGFNKVLKSSGDRAGGFFKTLAKIIRKNSFTEFKAYFHDEEDMADKMISLTNMLDNRKSRLDIWRYYKEQTSPRDRYNHDMKAYFCRMKEIIIGFEAEKQTKNYIWKAECFRDGAMADDPVTPETLLKLLKPGECSGKGNKAGFKAYQKIEKNLKELNKTFEKLRDTDKCIKLIEVLKDAQTYVAERQDIERMVSTGCPDGKCICLMREAVNELKAKIHVMTEPSMQMSL